MWRRRHHQITPNLHGADIHGAVLPGVNLSDADLSGADLTGADLDEADLSNAKLGGADLLAAHLRGANISLADLSRASLGLADLNDANLSAADLIWTNFSAASVTGTNFAHANCLTTLFLDLNLGKSIGLDECKHVGPSVIDFRTLSRSGNLPISFLRGCGLPDILIEYLPSLRGEALEFYSCFISYSAKDQIFAERLHADLQNKGVRCWFAPHDLPIGAKIWDAIDKAIQLRDMLLVVLSKASIGSDWVEDEVGKAYAEERSRKEVVLFPIRIDNAVMSTAEPWAVKLRDQRNIGDFRQWKKPAEYQRSLERLLRDLKASGAE